MVAGLKGEAEDLPMKYYHPNYQQMGGYHLVYIYLVASLLKYV